MTEYTVYYLVLDGKIIEGPLPSIDCAVFKKNDLPTQVIPLVNIVKSVIYGEPV